MLAGATTEQLSMLDRYEGMLEGIAPTVADDGRFDDADEAAGSPTADT